MAKGPKPIGVVTHFFDKISVAVIKFSKATKVGAKVKFKGATTDFEATIKSMQFDHESVSGAKKGQSVGVKVKEKVREGDSVFEVE